jgi:cysteine-rich repeat protein
MRRRLGPIAGVLVAALGGCEGNTSVGDTCEGITCSDHGACVDLAGVVQCVCDPGYHPVFLACVRDEPDGPVDGPEADDADRDDDARDDDDAGAGDRTEAGDEVTGEDVDVRVDDDGVDEDAAEGAEGDDDAGDVDGPEAADEVDGPVDGLDAEDAAAEDAEEGDAEAAADDSREGLEAEDVEAEDAEVPADDSVDGLETEDAEAEDDADRADADGDALPSCGNGVVEAPEECDDANGFPHDGCESDCTFTCHGPAECNDSNACTTDGCVPVAGGRDCANTPAPGSACDDHDPCTSGDVCDTFGACRGTLPETPEPPVPLAPENGALTGSIHAPPGFAVLRPEFRWRPAGGFVCGAAHYEVQVDDSCAVDSFATCTFPSPAASATASGTTWRPSDDLPVSITRPVGRRYYWRVRVCEGATCSDWSPVRYVDVGRTPMDLDGDGYSEVAAGAFDNDAGGSRAGRAYVYLGGALPGTTPEIVMTGEAANEYLGYVVAHAGDVNADGFADLVVSAQGNDAGGDNAGRVYVHLGAATLDSEPDLTFDGTSGRHLGTDVAGGGDMNADGYADVIVGADGPSGLNGSIHVYLGGAPPDSTADLTFDGGGSLHWAGGKGSTGWAGDMNGDGYSDLALGVPGDDTGGTNVGRVYVCFGGPSPDATADWIITGVEDEERLGNSVGGGADLDGDGYADLAVGTHFGEYSAAGSVFVYEGGSPPPSAPAIVIAGYARGAWPGRFLAWAGDVDGDRYPDLLLGAPLASGVSGGAVMVYLGGPAADSTADIVLAGAVAAAELGVFVAGGGDVNGDGFADVVAGAPRASFSGDAVGAAYVYFGGAPPDGSPDLILRGEADGDEFGVSVAIREDGGPQGRIASPVPSVRVPGASSSSVTVASTSSPVAGSQVSTSAKRTAYSGRSRSPAEASGSQRASR